MGWLQELGRNIGLMIHNIKRPEEDNETRVVRKATETEQRGSVTLRRTTIEEVEVHKGDANDPSEPST